ncbi:MAG TPA: hypothetical protein VMP00_02600 [Burkholderiales bacterium]|nr:hypothetical protein [Burkholderiales bacterium]
MRWVAPTEKDEANHQLEKRLWAAADQFRADSGLKAGEYSGPVLGLNLPALCRGALRAAPRATGEGGHLGAPWHLAHRRPQGLPGRRRPDPHAELPFDYLLQRPEGNVQ